MFVCRARCVWQPVQLFRSVALLFICACVSSSFAFSEFGILRQGTVSERLAFAYDNEAMTDGLGAQLNRVMGIYSFAKAYGLKYVHTPIQKIGYQGLASVENNTAVPDLEIRVNKLFNFPSDLNSTDGWNETRIPFLNLETVNQVAHQLNANQSLKAFVRIGVPSYCDHIPNVYEYSSVHGPFKKATSKVFRLALHVRRGELYLVQRSRMLPNNYYIKVAKRLTAMLEALGIDYVVELHTEIPTKSFVVSPDHFGIDKRISANTTMTPDELRIEEFDQLPKLVKYVNEDPLVAMERLATADCLVMSKSSFSYVSSVFNRGIVVYADFWHKKLHRWVNVDHNGEFTAESTAVMYAMLFERKKSQQT